MPITPQEALQRTIEHREIFHDEMLHLMRLIMNQMATATAASSTNITPLINSKRWPNVQAWRWLFMESPAALPPDHQGCKC